MALAGMHVTFGYEGEGEHAQFNNQPIFGRGVLSETVAASASTTQGAPAGIDGYRGRPVVMVTVSADSYIAIGPVPDTSAAIGNTVNKTRYYVKAATPTAFYCNVGDKVANLPA